MGSLNWRIKLFYSRMSYHQNLLLHPIQGLSHGSSHHHYSNQDGYGEVDLKALEAVLDRDVASLPAQELLRIAASQSTALIESVLLCLG